MDDTNRMDAMSSLPVSNGMMTPSSTRAPAAVMMSGGPMMAGGPMMTSAVQSSGSTNGMEHAIQLDEGLLQDLGWTNVWPAIQNRMQEELDQARKVRPLLPMWMDPSLDPEAIPDYTIKPPSARENRFQIPLQSRLVSVLISSEFRISTAQKGEIGVAMHLVSEAARRVGQAEDAVLLYGKCLAKQADDAFDKDFADCQLEPMENWPGNPHEWWESLSVYDDNLKQQDRFLFHFEYTSPNDERGKFLPPVRNRQRHQWYQIEPNGHAQPLVNIEATPSTVPPEDQIPALWEQLKRLQNSVVQRLQPSRSQRSDILDILLKGIERLRNSGHFGEYCAVVAPDLYKAAFAPRSSLGTDWDAQREAPIYQIRPLLREGGFGYSRMLMPGTGVIFSLGGGALTLAVPREAHVQFVSMDRDIILSVQERFRLLINRPDAIVPLCADPEYPTVRP
jgi:uncharacterized linocin/CFP29 family protein